MTQNEKVTVKLTLEMDVKTALTTFDGCKTAEDIVDCMVEELNDQFVGTGSGLIITDVWIAKDDEMPVEDAITQLKMDRDLCNFNPMTGEEEPMNEDCRKSAAALDIAIKALERESCEDCVSRAELKKWLDMNFSFGGALRKLELFDRLDKELPSVTPTLKWIPVSESFPKEHICDDGYVEPSETVLVQLNNGEMKTSRYWGSRESRKDEPWIDLSYPTTLEVVAWRPLPNKYSTPHDSRRKMEV